MTMRIFRVGVLILALGLVSTGLWALGAPNSWYATFPGLGHAWVAALGPYNEHLARDVGAALLGFGVLLAWTAAAPRAPLAPAALVAWLFFAVPHLRYHIVRRGALLPLDNAANLAGLALQDLLPLGLLLLFVRGPRPDAAARRRSEPGGRAEGAPARISGVGPREAGLMVRLTYWLARRMIGRLPTPLTVAAHHRWVLFGSNAYEFAAQHFHTVEPRLIGLAELKAGALVGCPW